MPSALHRAIPLALVAACADSSSSDGPPPEPPLSIVNLGLPVTGLAQQGDRAYLVVSEPLLRKDLDGDGDQLDSVLFEVDSHVVPFSRDRAIGTLLGDVPALFVGEAVAAFGLSEEGTGFSMNSDRDVLDLVPGIDQGAFGVRSMSYALDRDFVPVARGGIVAFVVSEPEEGGADVNDDGDGEDRVLLVADGNLTYRADVEPRTGPWISGTSIAFTVTEIGGSDLNGDGDAADEHVVSLFDLVGPRTTHVGLAATGEALLAVGSLWLAHVSEAGQGGQDLNGDGDAADAVWFAVERDSGIAYGLGLANGSADDSVVVGERVFLAVSEIAGVNENGDGDLDDVVPVVLDSRTLGWLSTGVALAPGPRAVRAGERVAFAVSEAAQGADLDGDGSAAGLVAHVVDTGSVEVENLGVHALALAASAELVVVSTTETSVGQDLNGDGALDDPTLWVWGPRTGAGLGVDLAGSGPIAGDALRFLFAASEASAGRDLNGDGDAADEVHALFDLVERRSRSLGLAVSPTGLPPRWLGPHRALLFVSETLQGADLDGDGDRDADVLFALRSVPSAH